MDVTDTGVGTPSPATLPIEVTSFVGRRAERQEVRALLADNRLVTLTGFGGVGKTRLALKVGGELRRAFKDGVVFVPLASLTDPELLAHGIAAALGLQGRSTRAPAPALVEYLSSRSVLLVLDNCEHVVDAVALLADTLLRTCPDLRLLATSREPLRIQGEAVHPVLPLSVPPRGTDHPLQQYEAVELFLDRSRALVADFELTDENRDAVARIVHRLEGIPLAIELAAGRLRAMSPAEVEQNLTERWELLSRGSRTAPDRQRTMAACIEWSFDLCTPTEQQLWARLSVFGDGFELDAARDVCGPLDEPVDDLLLDLVDKSIVIAMHESERTGFRLLPPLRHRGIAHLRERGELADVRRRHRDWYLELARRTSRTWMGPEQVVSMTRLRREMGNLHMALDFCFSAVDEVQPGLEMGSHLHEFGLADGLYRDSRLWFDRLLSRDPAPTEIRARALRTASWFAAMQGDLARGAELLEEGRSLAQRFGGRTEVLLTQASAFIAMFSREHEAASEQFETALVGFRDLGDTSQQAHTLALASLNHVFRGDYPAAIRAHEECLALTEPVGELWYRAYSQWIAGLAYLAAGDPERASQLERDSLRLKRHTRDGLGIGTSVEAIAYACAATDPARAARLLGAAQGIWDRIETSTEALGGLHDLHDLCVRSARAQLDDAAYDALFTQGRSLDPDGAIDLALDETPAAAAVPAARTPARRRPRDAAGPAKITPRERQIAELVATGMSNKDIAAQLVISKRTAETHVEHILTKLGFTNRNQIAAWMNEQSAGAVGG